MAYETIELKTDIDVLDDEAQILLNDYSKKIIEYNNIKTSIK